MLTLYIYSRCRVGKSLCVKTVDPPPVTHPVQTQTHFALDANFHNSPLVLLPQSTWRGFGADKATVGSASWVLPASLNAALCRN